MATPQQFGQPVTIRLKDGVPRKLHFDLNALIVVEETLGMPLTDLRIREEISKPGIAAKLRVIRALIYAGVVGCDGGDKSLTLENVGGLVDLQNLAGLDLQVLRAYEGAFSSPKNQAAAGTAGRLKHGTGRRR
jgi:hypothetical protein